MQTRLLDIKAIWRPVVLPFLLSRLLILVAGVVAIGWGEMRPDGWHVSSSAWLDMWSRWDSGFYLDIAAGGYNYSPEQLSSVAFFPLYPLLMRVISIGSDSRVTLTVVGWLISNLATLTGFYVLHRLTLLDHDEGTASRTIWLLAFFPTSFFLSVVYTEGLFFLLTVSAFYFARRKRWLMAAIAGGLSSATRLIGALILGPLAVERFRQKPRSWKDWLPLILTPFGLIGYMVFLNAQFGDPLVFLDAQAAWGRSSSAEGLVGRLKDLLLDPDLVNRLASSWLDILFTLVAVVILFVVFRNLRFSYALYCAYALGIPLVTVQVYSMPRFLIVAFPLFIVLAIWLNKLRFSAFLFRASVGLFALIQVAFVARWALWYWVA